jgi:hypothetical protein
MPSLPLSSGVRAWGVPPTPPCEPCRADATQEADEVIGSDCALGLASLDECLADLEQMEYEVLCRVRVQVRVRVRLGLGLGLGVSTAPPALPLPLRVPSPWGALGR